MYNEMRQITSQYLTTLRTSKSSTADVTCDVTIS